MFFIIYFVASLPCKYEDERSSMQRGWKECKNYVYYINIFVQKKYASRFTSLAHNLTYNFAVTNMLIIFATLRTGTHGDAEVL